MTDDSVADVAARNPSWADAYTRLKETRDKLHKQLSFLRNSRDRCEGIARCGYDLIYVIEGMRTASGPDRAQAAYDVLDMARYLKAETGVATGVLEGQNTILSKGRDLLGRISGGDVHPLEQQAKLQEFAQAVHKMAVKFDEQYIDLGCRYDEIEIRLEEAYEGLMNEEEYEAVTENAPGKANPSADVIAFPGR